MGGRCLPCGFGGRKEINVLNFVPGLYNSIIANTCKHKFKKKIKWGGGVGSSIRSSVP